MKDAQIGEVQGPERSEMVVPLAVGHGQWRMVFRSESLPPLGKLLQHWDFVQFLAQRFPQYPLRAWISTRGLDDAFRRGKPTQ
jgi:hypothetical protein